MKKRVSKYEVSQETDWAFDADDLMSVYYVRNGCGYQWGIPYRNFKSLENMQEPYKEVDLIALEGQLLHILVLDKQYIDFKDAKTGVQKLEVLVMSSETEDRQLLHKLTSEFRAKDVLIDKSGIPGTKSDDNK